MSTPAVVRLAGDVAGQFAHLPEDQAARRTADHLRMFWAPQMREELVDLARRGALADRPVLAATADLLGAEQAAS